EGGGKEGAADAVEAECERDVGGKGNPDQVNREEIPSSKPGREPEDLGVGGRARPPPHRPAPPQRGGGAAHRERRSDRAANGQWTLSFGPKSPVLGLPMVLTAPRASSTPGDSRCLEAPPPVHLARLHRVKSQHVVPQPVVLAPARR